MAVSSAAMSLRDSFGDRRVPDISRKITACVACRKQKIKCHMNGRNPPCSRCRARGLPCTVNKSLQMLLETDAGWKEGMELRLRRIEEALKLEADGRDSFPSSTPESSSLPPSAPDLNMEPVNHASVASNPPSESASDVALNLSCSLGAFPGSSMITDTIPEDGTRPDHKPDLISSGLISIEAAEEYFAVFRETMEPHMYQILAEDDCLATIRARSSLLTAVICAVGSYCADAAGHQKCHDAFIKEVSSKLFSRHYTFDDVRALCIGAFWLSKVSSTLIGLAVSMASDLNLHRCITKMPHTKRECYERTRLYFLVYICDHHCSLIYGKPPMTREFRSLKSPAAFLQSEFCIPADVKLMRQVELWSISSRVFDVFGADTEASISSERVAELQSLSQCFDMCRAPLFGAAEAGPDDFSQQLFDLYVNCAQLSLFSHTFRGSSKRQPGSPSTLNGMEKFEQCALESALAIVKTVALGDQIQKCLERLPSYFSTMIAFASISLIKASGTESTMCYLDKNEVFNALSALVEVLHACSERIQPEHLLCSVAKSLRNAMNGFCQSDTNNLDVSLTPGALDNALFAFDDFGASSFGMDYLGDHNDLLPYPNDIHSTFLGL